MSLPTFSFSSTADEVATGLSSIIAGKNVLVTGTSLGGIGWETAKALAKHANLVIITGYNPDRLKLSEEGILKEVPGANIRALQLDLSSLAAVRKAAAEVNAYPENIHVLVNNAAATGGTFHVTEDGFDVQMATDHFGPFLFTKLIAPKLEATRTADWVPRVVMVASEAHAMGPGLNLATVRRPDGDGSDQSDPQKSFLRYHEAKCACVLTAMELARRGEGKIRAYGLHPGTIPTNLVHKDSLAPVLKSIGMLNEDGSPNFADPKFKWKTIPQGAATNVVAAFDPRLDDKSGCYLEDCNESNHTRAPHCTPETAQKLWEITEESLGEKFVF